MLKSKLQTLPTEPGCYLMKDKNGEVIYVGKAKNLKNRVNSYFTGTHNNKTTKLVANIVDFEYIVVPSEKEALLLEYNLIKQYKPRFNIMFMDDASYPYIRLTKEQYPTIKLVRDKKKMKNAVYFGPYPNAGYAKELLSLIERLYPLRKCKNLEPRVCLYYHIGQCLGPCEFEIDKSVYDDLCAKITDFLNGKTEEITKEITAKRDEYSQQLMFEQAASQQELLEAIEHVTSNQIMQADKKASMDVFNYYVDNGYISIVGLLYLDGKLLHRHLLLKALYDDEEVEETFISYLNQYYSSNPLPKTLILPYGIDVEVLKEVLDTKIIQPQRGDKRKLAELALENARVNLEQKFEIINKESTSQDEALAQLQSLIHCNTTRIELYDNSHTAGKQAVGGQVVYIDGKPSKKDYRLYKVSNENNDFANMQEVLYRRLFRALKMKTVLPDIIIVDGGMPQIKAGKEILDSLGITSVKLLGLVKNDKHQTASLMNDDYEIIDIEKDSPLFYLLTNMQDEVHRFAITFHKKLRSQNMNKSTLDEIKGVGPSRKRDLLKAFGTIGKIKEATVEQLSEVVPSNVARAVYDYYHNEQPRLPKEDEPL